MRPILQARRLMDTASSLVADGKGLLAMDESTATCNQRFERLRIPQTEEARRAYRELILTTPGLAESISGAILYDETIRQKTESGVLFVELMTNAGIIPGIKVDRGARLMAAHPEEKITEGLDGLRERLNVYSALGARFAKWRAVIAVGEGAPSHSCIEANAHGLARYAALCQEAGLVPIVEPEVLPAGGHDLARCADVTGEVLRAVFHQLVERWTVRYLVADTRSFFDGRRVLISPVFFRHVDWATQHFDVALTTAKIKDSPSVDVDKPVSRQHERDYYGYYGCPTYWGYGSLWGLSAYPVASIDSQPDVPLTNSDVSDDVHLRSAAELRGYYIQGSDEAIGHVADFIVDDESWEVRYLVIDTSNWWFGKKVLIAPHWAKRVDSAETRVYVDLTRAAIKNSPEWDPHAPINRAYEERLYDYFGRPIYWETSRAIAGAPPRYADRSGGSR